MNNLSSFINYNKNCPVCGEKLTLCAQWIKGPCLIARNQEFLGQEMLPENAGINQQFLSPYQRANYLFPSKNIVLERFEEVMQYYKCEGDSMEILPDGSIKISNSLLNIGDAFYCFYLCKMEGINANSSIDYGFDLAKTCYLRISHVFKWQEPDDQINLSEFFTFKKDDCKYVLSLSKNEKTLTAYHEGKTPIVIPVPKYDFDFSIENRDKLIQKFNT